MLKFSICVPTRGRPDSITRLVDSIIKTTANIRNIQVIFRIDHDDIESFETISKISGIDIGLIKGERGHLSDMWNECYPHSKHDLLMMCADDVVFRTHKWDNILSDKIKDSNRELFIWCDDGIQGKNLATLPIISRKLIDKIGYFVPEGYSRDYCDTHLFDIVNRIKNNGVDLMYYFSDVYFEHMHPTVGKAKYDDTFKFRLKFNCASKLYNEREQERIEIAKRIAEGMK